MPVSHLSLPPLSLVASLYIIAVIAIALCLRFFSTLLTAKSKVLRAPGPGGHLLFGNAKQFPTDKSWLWYTKLSEQYGALCPVL